MKRVKKEDEIIKKLDKIISLLQEQKQGPQITQPYIRYIPNEHNVCAFCGRQVFNGTQHYCNTVQTWTTN